MSWLNSDPPEFRLTTNSLWTTYRKIKQAQLNVLSFVGAYKLSQDEGCYLWLAQLFQPLSVGWETVCPSCLFPPNPLLDHPTIQSNIWYTPNPSQPSLNFCSFHNKARACNFKFMTRSSCFSHRNDWLSPCSVNNNSLGHIKARVSMQVTVFSQDTLISAYYIKSIYFVCYKKWQIQWLAKAEFLCPLKGTDLCVLYMFFAHSNIGIALYKTPAFITKWQGFFWERN